MQPRNVPPAHRLARSVLTLTVAGCAAALVFAAVATGLAQGLIDSGAEFAAWARALWTEA